MCRNAVSSFFGVNTSLPQCFLFIKPAIRFAAMGIRFKLPALVKEVEIRLHYMQDWFMPDLNLLVPCGQ